MKRVVLLAMLVGVYALLASFTFANTIGGASLNLPVTQDHLPENAAKQIWIVTPEEVSRMKRGISLTLPAGIQIK